MPIVNPDLPFDPKMTSHAIKMCYDFMPHLDKAKKINLPGAAEIEQALHHNLSELTLIKETYHPGDGKPGLTY